MSNQKKQTQLHSMEISKFKKKIKSLLQNQIINMYGDRYEIFTTSEMKVRKYQAYCAMKHDMVLIDKYLGIIDYKTFDNTVNSALVYSIISIYGKCFTDAKSSKSPKLEALKIFTEQENIKTHEYLMNLRHHFIAHRGSTDSEIESTFGLYNRTTKTTKIEYARVKQMKFNEDERGQIISHIATLKSKIQTKIVKQEKRLNEVLLKDINKKANKDKT